MKHLIIAVFIAAISTSAKASSGIGEGSNLKIVPGENKFEVTYKASPKGNVKVNIYDSNKNRIYADVIKTTTGFARPYNFSGAPAGTYTFEIIDGENVVKEEVIYEKKSDDIKVSIDPVSEKRFKLAVSVMDNEMVYVYIYDKSQNLIFSDQVDVNDSFSRIYDLTKVASNEFTFEVTSSDSRVKQSVK